MQENACSCSNKHKWMYILLNLFLVNLTKNLHTQNIEKTSIECISIHVLAINLEHLQKHNKYTWVWTWEQILYLLLHAMEHHSFDKVGYVYQYCSTKHHLWWCPIQRWITFHLSSTFHLWVVLVKIYLKNMTKQVIWAY